ncbi:hypothetical protein, partial [Natrialba sp. PRR66]|uniref:hypothetical protein n=1 Tax=Natrialba sp. PRR66 TaxID=3098146 RepID=UPI002B1D6495
SDDSFSSVEEQLKQELENYVVLTRQSSAGDNTKEVKIVVSTPVTQGESVEVTMKPSRVNGYPQVSVNNEQITLKQDGDSETYHKQVTVLGLPNKEV